MNGQPFYQPDPYLARKQEERKKIKQDAGKVALLLLALTAISTGIVYGLSFFQGLYAGISGDYTFLEYGILPGMSQGMSNFLTMMLPVIITDVIIIIMARALLKMPLGRIFGKNEMHPGEIAFGATAAIGFSVIGQLISTFIILVTSYIGLDVVGSGFPTPEDDMSAKVLMLIYSCILAPLLEEIIFRGYILRSLQKYGVSFAVIFSSILFSMFHMNLPQMGTPLLIGLFLGYLTVKSKSIWPAIIAHALNNILAELMGMFFPEDELGYWLSYLIYAVVFLGVMVVYLILKGGGFKRVLLFRSPILKLSQQFGAACSSAGVIVYFVVYAGTIAATTLIYTLQLYF